MSSPIPKDQNRPPAGAIDELAQMPKCSQIKQYTDTKGVTHYYVDRSDGQAITLYSGQAGVNHTWLDSAGLCKVNGQEIVLTAPSGVQSVRYVDLIPVADVQQASSGNVWGFAILAGLTVLAGLASWYCSNLDPSTPPPEDDDEEEDTPSWLT